MFPRLGIDDGDGPFAQIESPLERFEKAAAARGSDPILDHLDAAGERLAIVGGRIIDAVGLAVDPDPQVGLLLEKFEKVRDLCPRRHIDAEDDQERALAAETFDRFPQDGFGRVGRDFLSRDRVVAFADAGEEQLQVVVDLRDRPDRGAGRLDRILLLDRDGRRDALDRIDLRFVHAVEELPRVGRKGFDVAPLALGVERLKGETRLARAARTGHDGEFPDGNIEVDALEIVLAGAAHLDRCGRSHRLV